MIEEPALDCPYCGETISVVVDTTAGNQSYVEDCFVCCQPIVLHITVDETGTLLQITGEPENP